MKAWTVDRPDEEASFVVFAETRGKARAKGQGMDGMYNYLEYRVKRLPEFDKYAEHGSVPISVLLGNGCWYECGGCDYRITGDSLTERKAEMVNGYPYCTKCAAKLKAKEATP